MEPIETIEYWDKNGLMESATNAIDCYLESERKKKIKKTKAYIKNHVPLLSRS